MAGLHPEQRIRAAVLAMSWLDIAFVHWRFPSRDVQALLPDGLTSIHRPAVAWCVDGVELAGGW